MYTNKNCMDWNKFVGFSVDLGKTKLVKKKPIFPKNWQKLEKNNGTFKSNFAILTGKINGIIVIDIDTKKRYARITLVYNTLWRTK